MLKRLTIITVLAIPFAYSPNEASAQQKQKTDNQPPPPVTVNCDKISGDQQPAPYQKPPEPHTGIEYSQWVLIVVAALTGLAVFDQAKAATKAARSSEKSADVLVNSERAWILVELKCDPTAFLAHGDGEEGPTTAVMDVELRCTNHGTSPAWITEKSARLVNTRELPPIPQLTKEDIITEVLEPIGPGKESIEKWTPSGEGHYSPFNSALIVYGVVRYRDIFQATRETWFCYQLTGYQHHRKFIRVNVPTAYIKHT